MILMDKIKIAIIDDETEYVNDLAKGLEILGYEVKKAVSGVEAIDVIAKDKPDIALCDYKLGDMDGTQIIEKTKFASPNTVYIMVTAYFDESFEDVFKKAGASNVIYKPVQLMELDSVIKAALKKA